MLAQVHKEKFVGMFVAVPVAMVGRGGGGNINVPLQENGSDGAYSLNKMLHAAVIYSEQQLCS